MSQMDAGLLSGMMHSLIKLHATMPISCGRGSFAAPATTTETADEMKTSSLMKLLVLELRVSS